MSTKPAVDGTDRHRSRAQAEDRDRLKPYKGTNSFQEEDQDLFFGRDRESRELIEHILSARFSVVHAQSGAGKTSLLNARIVPNLERRGWTPIVIRLMDHPVRATRNATLAAILPPLQVERDALDRAVELLRIDDDQLTINQLLSRYDELSVRTEAKRLAVTPVDAHLYLSHEDPNTVSKFSPYFHRLLGSTIDLEDFREHMLAVRSFASEPPDDVPGLDETTTIAELRAFLSMPALEEGYRRLAEQLDIPVSGLWAFFENLVQTYGKQRTRFSLVLVFDQFEELFTRFVEQDKREQASSKHLPDWRLRWDFIEELRSLYETGFNPHGFDDDGPVRPITKMLPIRFVLSMRSEYVALLDPFARFVNDLPKAFYHLDLLEKHAAGRAIEEPARIFGYGYHESCYERLIGDLVKEDRFVEPAHLQLVCDRLWNDSGRDLSRRSESSGEQARVELETYVQSGGVEGILSSLLDDCLKEAEERSWDDMVTMLELLEPLITSGGTRNIVEKNQLLHPAFRVRGNRGALLDTLVDRTIVRIEHRLGGEFVEITHEFLINPVLRACQERLYSNQKYNAFRIAMRSLERYASGMLGSDVEVLPAQDLQILHKNRSRIQWTRKTVRLMVRSGIVAGVGKPVLEYWINRFMSEDEDTATLSMEIKLTDIVSGGRPLLTPEELSELYEQGDSLNLSQDQLLQALRSVIVNAQAGHRDSIINWTRRALQ